MCISLYVNNLSNNLKIQARFNDQIFNINSHTHYNTFLLIYSFYSYYNIKLTSSYNILLTIKILISRCFLIQFSYRKINN